MTDRSRHLARAFERPVYVTRPLLPKFEAYAEALRKIWHDQWLTNKGPMHDALEQALCHVLGVSNISLVNNATTGLVLSFRAFRLSGEVVTTPFTFPATVNAISWCGLQPVFADIDPATCTLDPAAVERAITPRTAAIVAVHVYGMPCQHNALARIATRHHLRLIYDSAHAFGTEINGKSVLELGDASILSFHATKLFNTAEGGAVVVPNRELKRSIDLLRNHGIVDEVTVTLPGINAKMTEFAAGLGLANLDMIAAERRAREEIAEIYRLRLAGIEGLSTFDFPSGVRQSLQYFVIRIDNGLCPISRDDLYERLKGFNIFARRYFYPLCSNFSIYRDLPSSNSQNLAVANRVASEVLCLPFYGALGTAGAHQVCDIIVHLIESRGGADVDGGHGNLSS
jgi:dTDP-4-amino-4,6-dideoxygalactose transaminase